MCFFDRPRKHSYANPGFLFFYGQRPSKVRCPGNFAQTICTSATRGCSSWVSTIFPHRQAAAGGGGGSPSTGRGRICTVKFFFAFYFAVFLFCHFLQGFFCSFFAVLLTKKTVHQASFEVRRPGGVWSPHQVPGWRPRCGCKVSKFFWGNSFRRPDFLGGGGGGPTAGWVGGGTPGVLKAACAVCFCSLFLSAVTIWMKSAFGVAQSSLPLSLLALIRATDAFHQRHQSMERDNPVAPCSCSFNAISLPNSMW